MNSSEQLNRRQKFDQSENFAIYYGQGMEFNLNRYDISVIEPSGHTQDGVNIIKETGTLAIGYVSLIEINPSNPVYRYLDDNDFMKLNGTRMMNKTFGNYMADLRSEKWRKILSHEIAKLLLSLEYDGIFIDTVTNAEDSETIREYGLTMVHTAAAFITEIREKFPEHIIIQNNALEQLLTYTSKEIDGICWENPPIGSRKSLLWVQEIISKLDDARKQHNLKRFIVYESKDQDDARILEGFNSKGYLTYLAAPGYLDLYF